MAFFQRYQSAPTLLNVGDNTYVVVGLKTQSSDESSDGEESVYSVKVVEAGQSETQEPEDVATRKKRQAPLPPASTNPTVKLFRSHTSTESSDNQMGWSPSASTESDTLPAPSRSSLQLSDSDTPPTLSRSSLQLSDVDYLQQAQSSPKERSRFLRLRNALRSPQIGRSKSKKDRHELSRSMAMRSVDEGETPVRMRRNLTESGSWSPKFRQKGDFEPFTQMSKCIVALGCENLEGDQDFEITKVSDYFKYLEELLKEPERTPEELEVLSELIQRIRDMVQDSQLDKTHLGNASGIADIIVTDNGNRVLQGTGGSQTDIIFDSMTDCKDDIISTRSGTSGLDLMSDIVNETDNSLDSSSVSCSSIPNSSVPSAAFFKPPSGSRWSASSVSVKSDLELVKSSGEFPRLLLKESFVTLATGMQTQERYLFLFTDLLLVAKYKTNTVFKLKYKVYLRDMWLASNVDEVFESSTPADRCFVLGWPTANFVAIFPKQNDKEEWLQLLTERMTAEKTKDHGKTVHLTVVSRIIHTKLCESEINNKTTANVVLQTCLEQMNIAASEAQNYQLWVRSGKDGAAYPLFGHETPFSIKLNQLHEQSKTKSRDELLKALSSGDFTSEENSKCEFFIKQKKVQKKNSLENSPFQKSMKKSKKSPNFINSLWKRIRPSQPMIFGQPLSNICDENNNPPEAVIKLMVLIYQYGPNMQGILRRGDNKALGKEIREKIDNGVKFELEEHHTPTAASVFKEFIRCIPDGLLLNELHNEWVQIKINDPENDKIRQIKIVLDKLPPAHFTLIKLTICLLQHLAKHSSHTQMGPSNLATCIAPSFCCQDAKGKNKTELLKKSAFEIINNFTPLITFMIVKHVEIFGEDVLNMFEQFGCQQSPIVHISEEKSILLPSQQEVEDILEEESFEEESKIKLKQRRANFPDSNSGTDSDSLHSVLSLPTDTHVGLHQDTSSIDSLVDKEDFSNEMESSPVTIKSHLSPTNLSRDSGLTLSDTQLYDDDVGMEFINTSKLSHSPVLNQHLDYSFTPKRYYKNKMREKESRQIEPFNFPQRYMKMSASELKNDNERKENIKEAHSLPVDLDLSSKNTSQHRIIAQSSVDESISPVSTHASVFSQSEEGSVHSAPQTPNDFCNRSLDWQVNNDINQTQISPLYFHLSHFGKSEVNLKTHSDQNVSVNFTLLKKDNVRLKRNWKSHEAEEITSRKNQPRLVLPPRDLFFDQPSPTSPLPPLAEQKTPPFKRNIHVDHIKGSPPPNVILQSFNKNLNVDNSNAQKKIITVSKSVDNVASNITQAAVQKAKRKIQITHPKKSLHLQQTAQKSVLQSCNEPLDITEDERERQKEISARAKVVYEESLKKYKERVESDDFIFSKKYLSSTSTKNEVAFDSSTKHDETVLIPDSHKITTVKGFPKLTSLTLEKQVGITCDSPLQYCDTSHSDVVNSNIKSPKEFYLETIKENEIKTHSHQGSKLHPNSSFHSSKSVPFKKIFKAGGNDLHRSYSDADDVRLKIQSVKDKTKEINMQDISVVKDQKKNKEMVSALLTDNEGQTSTDMESDLGSKVELHEKFLKAKNFFNQTAESQHMKKGAYTNSTNLHKASSVMSLHSSAVNSPPLIITDHSKTENLLAAKQFQSVLDPLLKTKFKMVETPLPLARHKSVSTNELSIKSNATVQTKSELPWSVKNLKSQWDKEGFKSSVSKNSNILKQRDHQNPASSSSSYRNINLISSPKKVDTDYKTNQTQVQFGGNNLEEKKNSLLDRKSEQKINSESS